MWCFDKEFDKQIGDVLIASVQERMGCFFCESPGAANTCGRCKVAVYCNRDCQRNDWKKDRHKHLCEVYCDNAKQEAVPICLKSCHYITEVDFVVAMADRQWLFLEEMSKGECDLDRKMAFQTAVIYNLRGIYLMGAPTFVDGGFNRHMINHIICIPLDDATDEIKGLLYQGSGKISTFIRERVIETWVTFLQSARQHNCEIISITVGRGLMDFAEKKSDFKAQLAEKGFNPIIVPSSDYLFM
jgi:hypothetical protein